MAVLYDLFIRVYQFGIWLMAPFNPKAKDWYQGRKQVWDELQAFKKKNPKNIWVHCASVGEFEQGLPLIIKLQESFPDYTILLSFFSPSGYNFVAKNYPELCIIYLPIDTRRNSSKWIQTLQPQTVFFVKYEFWHHYFVATKKSSIPLFMVSAVFWKELFFFKWYAGFFRKALKNVSHFFVQNDESKALLENIGLNNITVNGDLRYDRVLDLKRSAFSDQKIASFISNQKTFVAGSAWNSDIDILIKIIYALPSDFKIIIAPHEIKQFDYAKFTHLDYSKYSDQEATNCKILFLDTIGLLSRVYRLADLVYVGGGFGKGIHNILEPAVYNKPILIGPNYQRFFEAKQLIKLGLVQVLKGEDFVDSVLNDSLDLDVAILKANTTFFSTNANASEQIIVFIKKEGILV